MGVIEEIQGFLFWALLNARIPASILALPKVIGCFQFVWKWALLTDVMDAAKVLNRLVNGGHPSLKDAFLGNHKFSEKKVMVAYQDILAAGQLHGLIKWLFERQDFRATGML